ncbi:hypothetical protein A4U94_03650 [Prescottella equi]|uniref:hypothetical protein n=1 Tax=Rhodococcus hoagii TaxID=43767 RepID=UPI0009F081C7|nr:hypothetical protein [Prescottella equi]OQQ29120.1 hypothetical protein A4U94_03650 [Prescottella equi]
MANIPSSQRLLSLITMDNTGLNRGKVKSLVDGGRPKRLNDAPYPTAVREFLDGFLQSMLAQDVDAATLRHPAEDAARSAPVYPPSVTALEAPDLAWLQRLPKAEEISYADAVQLARFAQFPFGMNSSSKRLVESLWQPVNELYDARVAEAMKAKTVRPLFKIPSPVGAVAVAIENEHPYLTPEEARGRAEELVDEALAERRAINDRRRAEADSSAAKVADRKRTRTAQEVWA